MTRPGLEPRVERLEEDLTSVADTVIDIKETVDGHTPELAAIRTTLAEHDAEFVAVRTTLAEHGTRLAAIEASLTAVDGTLTEILRRLDPR